MKILTCCDYKFENDECNQELNADQISSNTSNYSDSSNGNSNSYSSYSSKSNKF